MTQDTKVPVNFADLKIAQKLLDVLAHLKFITPTPIQHQCIPQAIEGKDIVGIAQTGTGKTLAFGIPMLQRIAKERGQGLILLPTRELALQVDDALQKIGRPLGLRTIVLIGGASSYQQKQALKQGAHVIISTPGRLIDHLDQRNLNLMQVKTLVLDEADRMLDIGFMPQIKKILEQAPTDRQTMLFSATMPSQIAGLAAKYMRSPLRIEVAPAGTASANVEQEVFFVNKDFKAQLLDKILTENPGKVIIFSRTKHGAKKIAMYVRAMGHTAAEIHSNRSLPQRKAALEGFKGGRFRVLVATDIAARGIDVFDIALVINYDLPDNLEDYVHRIGRTGRAGKFGKAISFAMQGEKYNVKQIERLIKKTIPVLDLPQLPPKREKVPETMHVAEDQNRFSNRSRGGRPGFGGRGRSGGNSRFGESKSGGSNQRSSQNGFGARKKSGGFSRNKSAHRSSPSY
jgi:ATP-dependent RNA helicase RhlE